MNLHIKTCPVCGVRFVPKNRQNKTCGKKCGTLMRDMRLQEARSVAVRKLPTAEKEKRIKLLVWLNWGAKQRRRGDVVDIDFRKLREAWKKLSEIPLRVKGERKRMYESV